MKVKFATEELKKRLSQLGTVVAKKAAQPVFGFVRLFAVPIEGGHSIGITGVDIDATLTVTFTKSSADGPVDVLLPFGKLTEIIGAVNATECTIDTDGETKATFKAGKYKADLKTHPLTNWPSILERPETAIATLALPALKEQIAQVEFAVPANDGKFVVSVAKVESTPEAFRLIATDGFRLALSSIPLNAGTFTLVLPKPALDLIKKLDGAQLTISEAEGGFYFETELEQLTVSRSHGEFPNYAGVLPKSFKTTLAFKKKALLDALKRVKPLADPDKPVIVFSAAEGGTEIAMWAAHVESGTDGTVFRNMASDEIEATITGPAVEVAMDAALLMPFLEQAYGSGDGDITAKISIATAVVDFYANGEQYRFLLMPTQPPNRA